MNPRKDIAAAGKARANAFMAQFADYEKSPAYQRRKKALDDRQAKSLAKDLSGKRKGGIEELRSIPGFVENESEIRKENALHLAMMEAKKRSGLNQLEILGLDYEEFILFYRKNYEARTLFSHFLIRGNLAFSPFLSEFETTAFLQKHIKASKGDLNIKILANIANFMHQPLNSFKIYKNLKAHIKLSKDKLYQNIADLEDQNLIKTILHINDNITLKRVYFSDFALKSALSLHKDPKATIANMVFCELLKLKKEIKYSNQIDFIVPNMSYGILILPFLPSELAILKAKKLSNHCNELGLKRVDIISNSQSQIAKFEKITYNVMPFWQWAVGLS